MKQSHADLRIVDEIVRVLLPDAETQVARPQRQMTAELELRIAFRLQIELGECRLQRKVEPLRSSRTHVLKRERFEEAPDVGVDARALTDIASEFQPRAERPEALRELRRFDREEIVAKAVVDLECLGHAPAVLDIRLVCVSQIRVVVDHGHRSGSEETVRLQCHRVVLEYVRQIVRYAGRDVVVIRALRVVGLEDLVDGCPLVGECKSARRREKHRARVERVGAVRRRAAVAVRRRLDVQRFAVDEVVHRIAEILDGRSLERRTERQRTRTADRVVDLQREKRVVLPFVIVRRSRFAVVDVVWDLERAAAVNDRDVGEIVRTARQREADELIGRTRIVVRRVEVRRIQAACGLLTADRHVETAPARDRRVKAERRVESRVGSDGRIVVDSRQPGSGPRRHIEHGAEFQTVLRRVRALEEVDEREVVQVDLASDIAIELLRQRDAVEQVVDDAVVAVHVHDAVCAADRARKLDLHFGEAVVDRQACERRAVENDVASASVDRRRPGNDDVP
ncbi:MAG TPA: hypothetical protein VKT51_10325 [Candidatus Eremiobacteraceae bacterium]|nr:hypothetical protein [Candidatus Eremiobacteraceae bacterium]